MSEQGLDALVLAQPESIKYATGAFPGVATFWRRAGAAFVVVPHDGPMTAIVGDLQVSAQSRRLSAGLEARALAAGLESRQLTASPAARRLGADLECRQLTVSLEV